MKTKNRSNKPDSKWLSKDVTDAVLLQFRKDFCFDGSPAELVALPLPNPDEFQDSESFRSAYWRAEMWSKYPFNTGVDREAAAMQSFAEYELRCADANRRLCDLWARPVPEGTRRVLRHARRLLADLFRGFTRDEVIQHCSWGPGASTSMSRAQATPQNKWCLANHITEACLPWFYSFSQWSDRVFTRPTIVSGNKVITVPKNAKTDRTIAIEPDWNCFFQLGLGGAIRSRLQRRFGLLQKYAQGVNKILARKGSEDGLLATLDLKGASDGVSLALVEALLPEDVYQVICELRSPTGTLKDGSVVHYEKVSSMGNGFTFELETAIFYCLSRAASGHAVVYGDDILVVSTAYQQVVDVLTFCGFVANEKKSFAAGPFRESCGGHFFHGVEVTPPYVRRALRGPARLSFCNRVSKLLDNGHWRDSLGLGIWTVCSDGIPSFLEGPSTVDGCLHVSEPKRLLRKKHLFTFHGCRVVEKYHPAEAIPEGALLQALWSGYVPSVETRYKWHRPPGRPRVQYATWVCAWQGVSPWASLTTS